ncbi:MAG TPA: hypothetical protein VF615_13870 [Longimicrobiaceae bacterium]|jgi:hypothetical protein
MKRPTGLLLAVAAALASILAAAWGDGDPARPAATAAVSGVVRAATGAAVQGASVKIGSAC